MISSVFNAELVWRPVLIKFVISIQKTKSMIRRMPVTSVTRESCTINCVGHVFTFGDINDPMIQKKLKLAKPLHPEFKTKPSVYYIPFRNRKWDVI